MAGTSLMLAGNWNATPAVSVVHFASNLEVTALVWNMAIGIYHCLLVYALNKYGIHVWFRIWNWSDSISWWKSLGISCGQLVTGPVMEDEVLRRKLETLAEKGWETTSSVPNEDLGQKEVAKAMAMAADEEAVDGDEDRDEGEQEPTTISHSLSCSLVLAFQCALSDEQIYQWADKMRKMYGSTPRVERFERSTIVQTSVWTHEGLLHDAAALVREACEGKLQCTLQVETWGVFLSDAGHSTGEKVKLIKLQGLSVPVITSASQCSAVDVLEIRGLNLKEADLIAQTHDQSMKLLSEKKESRDSEELEALCVQCPPDHLHQDIHVYASKTIAVDGSLISVQCEPVKVVSTSDNLSTTDSTTWVMTALVMLVPVTQIALSLLYPSFDSPLAITVGQGLGWMLGWLTRKFFAGRNSRNEGKACKPAEKKGEEIRSLSENAVNQVAVPSKLVDKKEEEHPTLSETVISQDAVPSKSVFPKPAVEKKNFSVYLRRGGLVVLLVLLILLSHWVWTHMEEFEKKWLLVGTTTAATFVIIWKLQAKLLKTKDEDIPPSKFWMNVMSTAVTYAEWAHAASMLHSHTGINEAKFYDEAYVLGKLRELRARRMKGITQEILFFLRADLIRHLGNMCNPILHKCRNEVPGVIRDYVNEVRYHLQAICEMDEEEFTLEEKLTFLTETRQRFGRTALVFSGHVAMGTFHSSVFRTLVEHQLLPSVIVGANLGAIVASFATTRTASELRHFFDDPSLPMDLYEKLSTVYVAAYRLRTQEARPYEIEKLQQSMRDLLGDLTFEEAFDLSGRILGISILACPTGQQPAQFLNYLASPHVVVWSAVALSCVPPSGLLHRPELMIKDRYNRIVSYIPPSKVTFQKAGSETSLETEIPFRQVEELFNVNHFIVSQASPYIASWLNFKEATQERSPLAAKFVNVMEMEVRHRCAQLSDMGIKMRGITSLCAQKWEGDINITLPVTFTQAVVISTTQNDDPSPDELRKAAMAGRRCTWAKLSAIHTSCGIELMLDEYINELRRRERHALHREEDFHRLNDVSYLQGSRQLEFDIGRSARPNVNTAQSSHGDYTSNVNDELPLEHLTPGHCTPSEAETEDYLLDHLCSCTSNRPGSLMRCDMVPAISDQRVHLVDEDCFTIDDSHGAGGDITWFHLPDEPTTEDHPGNEEHVMQSVCEQYRLHNRDLLLEWELGCEEVDSYGSPTTVLEGPSGRSRMQVREAVDTFTHPGCHLERYFEEISNSSYYPDERDDEN